MRKKRRMRRLISLATVGIVAFSGLSVLQKPSDAGAAIPPQAQAIISAAEQYVTTPVTPYCWDAPNTQFAGPDHGEGEVAGQYSGPPGESRYALPSEVGFDCTGLTMVAIHQALPNLPILPHSPAQASGAIADGGQLITSEQSLHPGNLVYFKDVSTDSLDHIGIVAIYIGNDKVVNAYDYNNDGHNGQPKHDYWGVAIMPLSWWSVSNFLGGVRLWSAALPPPTVTNFTASPSTLSSAGGQVTLSANVTNATSCTFASNKTVSGLTSAPCSNGTVSDVVTVPAIGTKASASYRFGLSVAGSKIISAPSIKFLESGAAPPSVSQLTATPSTLTSAGGIVSLVTELANATTCKFTSSRPVTGLSSRFTCSNESLGAQAVVPANRGHSALIYKFTFTVIGAGRVSTTADVTVEPSTSPPPILDWTENQLPNAFGNALSCGTSSFCLFAGQNGTWVSNDGGSTWTQDYPSWGPITGISCSGVECVEVGGSLPPHRSYSTPDGGETWNGYVFAGDVGDVSCAPVDLCVVSGLNNSGLPVAWVTTDGGATWTENLLPGGTTSDTYVGVYCASAQTAS